MNDKAYAERRRQMSERRTRTLFQPMRLGNVWYIVRWPEGEILPVTTTNETEAREFASKYAAAHAVA